MSDFFTKDNWRDVAMQLRGGSRKWWKKHEALLVGLAKDEMADVFAALSRGRRREAKYEVVARMDRETWAAYRDGTTAALRGIAERRAKLLAALEELGWITAHIIGNAALSAL